MGPTQLFTCTLERLQQWPEMGRSVEPGEILELDPEFVETKHVHPNAEEGGTFTDPKTGDQVKTTTRRIPWLKPSTRTEVLSWCAELRRRAQRLARDDDEGDPALLARADALEAMAPAAKSKSKKKGSG